MFLRCLEGSLCLKGNQHWTADGSAELQRLAILSNNLRLAHAAVLPNAARLTV